MYRIRMVDASDDDIADTLTELHRLTFFDTAATPKFDLGAWWLAYQGDDAVALALCRPLTRGISVTSPELESCRGIGAGGFSSG